MRKFILFILCEYWSYRYTVGGGKLYQLAENEDTEEWELYITEIL